MVVVVAAAVVAAVMVIAEDVCDAKYCRIRVFVLVKQTKLLFVGSQMLYGKEFAAAVVVNGEQNIKEPVYGEVVCAQPQAVICDVVQADLKVEDEARCDSEDSTRIRIGCKDVCCEK